LSSFFCSSRRRHTRLVSDWSSDVCSSDLSARRVPCQYKPLGLRFDAECDSSLPWEAVCPLHRCRGWFFERSAYPCQHPGSFGPRSEERRVGKEGRCRWAAEP